MPRKHNLPAKPTDRGSRHVHEAVGTNGAGARKVPGPSPNPATNLILADIAMRSAMHLFRRTMEKGLLSTRFTPGKADRIVEGRTFGVALMSAVAARVATRSVPGALLVGGGILGKTLLDRSMSRRKAVREGDEALEEQAENA